MDLSGWESHFQQPSSAAFIISIKKYKHLSADPAMKGTHIKHIATRWQKCVKISKF